MDFSTKPKATRGINPALTMQSAFGCISCGPNYIETEQ